MFTHSPAQQRTTPLSSEALVVEHDVLQKEIDELIKLKGDSRGELIPILHEIRKRHAYIDCFAMQYVADRLGISAAEVYGVVSFYSFLKEENLGKFTIRLCRTISCDMAGKQLIAQQLEKELGIKFGETTTDGLFTLEWANCIGMCDQGPGLLVNEQVFTEVTPKKVREILDGCRKTYQENKQGGS